MGKNQVVRSERIRIIKVILHDLKTKGEEIENRREFVLRLASEFGCTYRKAYEYLAIAEA
jgi:hypothetical protein